MPDRLRRVFIGVGGIGTVMGPINLFMILYQKECFQAEMFCRRQETENTRDEELQKRKEYRPSS